MSSLHQQMRPSARRLEIIILSFTKPLPGLLSQLKHFMARRPEETICCLQAWSIRCSLFCHLWLVAGGYFSLDNFNILCAWPNWFSANKWHVSFTLFQNKCWCQTRSLRQEAVPLLSTCFTIINTRWNILRWALNILCYVLITILTCTYSKSFR